MSKVLLFTYRWRERNQSDDAAVSAADHRGDAVQLHHRAAERHDGGAVPVAAARVFHRRSGGHRALPQGEYLCLQCAGYLLK